MQVMQLEGASMERTSIRGRCHFTLPSKEHFDIRKLLRTQGNLYHYFAVCSCIVLAACKCYPLRSSWACFYNRMCIFGLRRRHFRSSLTLHAPFFICTTARPTQPNSLQMKARFLSPSLTETSDLSRSPRFLAKRSVSPPPPITDHSHSLPSCWFSTAHRN